MKNTLYLLSLFLFFISSCKKNEGCTDILASNYDSSAEIDDGSCIYEIFEEPVSVYIYSVVATPTSDEKVTLRNNTGLSVDLNGWTLGDSNDPNAYNIPSGNILNDQHSLTFDASTMGFQINDNDETIYLKNPAGSIVDTWIN